MSEQVWHDKYSTQYRWCKDNGVSTKDTRLDPIIQLYGNVCGITGKRCSSVRCTVARLTMRITELEAQRDLFGQAVEEFLTYWTTDTYVPRLRRPSHVHDVMLNAMEDARLAEKHRHYSPEPVEVLPKLDKKLARKIFKATAMCRRQNEQS